MSANIDSKPSRRAICDRFLVAFSFSQFRGFVCAVYIVAKYNSIRSYNLKFMTGKIATPLLLHPFNGLFSGTTWVSRYEKGKTSLDLNEERDDWVLG